MDDPVRAAASGCCPRCGRGRLYAGLLRFNERCPACGLDFAAFNVGDGPAAFLTLIIGAVVVGLALWVELSFSPPWWVHVLLWLPLVVLATIASLRVTKGVLLALEYRNQAAEGRLDGDE
jgi:uncharacterized protein (DUF983 family)